MGIWTACSVAPVVSALLPLAGRGGTALLSKIGGGLAWAALPGPGLGALDAADYLAGRQTRHTLGQLRHTAIRLWVVGARDSMVQGADALISLLRSMPLLGVSSVIPAAAGAVLGPIFSIASAVLHGIHAGIDGLRSRRDRRAAEAALARGVQALAIAAPPPELGPLYTSIHQHLLTNQQHAIQNSVRDRTRALLRAAYAAASSPLGIAALSLSIVGAATSAGIALSVAAHVCGLIWLGYLTYTAYRDNAAAAAAQALDQARQQECMAWASHSDEVLEQHLLADAGAALQANPKLAVLWLARHQRPDWPALDEAAAAQARTHRRAAKRYLRATGMARPTVRALCLHPAGQRVPDAVLATLSAHLLGAAAHHPDAPIQPDQRASRAFAPGAPQFRYNARESASAPARAASPGLLADLAPLPHQSDRKV